MMSVVTSLFKRLLFQLAGSKYDRMAAAKKQTYDFLFVHEDGSQLDRIGRLFDKEYPLETSIDTVPLRERRREEMR